VPRLSGGVASQDRPRRYFSWVQRAHLAPRLCRPEASTTSGSEEPRTRAESGWHTATAPTSHPRSSPSHGGGVEAARWICVDCPVRSQCLEYALANRIGDRMWGGTSEQERRAMLSEHDRSYLRPPLGGANSRRCEAIVNGGRRSGKVPESVPMAKMLAHPSAPPAVRSDLSQGRHATGRQASPAHLATACRHRSGGGVPGRCNSCTHASTTPALPRRSARLCPSRR
jgi:hypothetical protein